MSAKMVKDCLSLAGHSWLLGAEAALVVPLRLARLARGGAPGASEASRMVAEKIEAHTALVKAWHSGDLGQGALAQSQGAVQHYLGYVRANRVRLMQGED